ncbi:mechanosensitive ion channel [Halobacteriovorax sp. GB3]|uniref:mechanosensitive ion channel family protein n=1 Tax=Halobacteriovorax sp. GB3 TaxID=2719615 RepID=UPI00235E851F|nr:mechanosensitive ion channel family protein [Halobacteriovorax sp. GB3]MDD0853082.1 mechanosensitive ion channel [Halobacteriovorax sp. GB3]
MKIAMLIFNIIFFALITKDTLASDYPKATLESPRSSMNFFLKTMKGYKTGDKEAINLAIKALSKKGLDPQTKKTTLETKAKKLIQTIDKIEYVDVKTIPNEWPAAQWVYRKRNVTLGDEDYQVTITLNKEEDEKWRFSPETLSSIDYYEKALSGKNTAKDVVELNDFKTKFKKSMPVWTSNKNFLLLNGQWIALGVILFLCLLTDKLTRLFIANRVVLFLKSRGVAFSAKKQNRLTAPIGLMAFSGLWSILVRPLELEDQILSIFLRIGIVAFTLGAVITVHNIVDVICFYLEKKARESENKFDDILVPLIRKTAKFFVLGFGIIFIGNSLTIDMKSILAGMGIGGIAFALAAKDTISNLFGSFTVLIDRPFSIGDWVVINGNVEGTVEEVGLRSTRIRTFYDSLISLPNGTLTNVHIDNYGKRTYRRYSTKISLEYSTPVEKIESFCQGIRELILAHKWTRKDYFHVYFNDMNASSLDVLLYVFWQVPDWSAELQERHRLLLDIVRLAKELGVNFAFPTQTVHLFNEQKSNEERVYSIEEMERLAKEKAHQLSVNQLTSTHEQSGQNKNYQRGL